MTVTVTALIILMITNLFFVPHPHPHRHPLIRGRVAGGAAQAGGPRLPFPGPH